MRGGSDGFRFMIWFLTERQKYVRAMLKAIHEAGGGDFDRIYQSSRTDGLRAIKSFERVNKTRFNPFSEWHVYTVSGWGWMERVKRRQRWKK